MLTNLTVTGYHRAFLNAFKNPHDSGRSARADRADHLYINYLEKKTHSTQPEIFGIAFEILPQEKSVFFSKSIICY